MQKDFLQIWLGLKSERERYTLVALKKRAIVSNRSLTNIVMSDLLVFWEYLTLSPLCSQKTSDSLEKICSFHHVFDSFSRAMGVIHSWKRENCYLTLFLTKKNEWFAEKTKSEFPTMEKWTTSPNWHKVNYWFQIS